MVGLKLRWKCGEQFYENNHFCRTQNPLICHFRPSVHFDGDGSRRGYDPTTFAEIFSKDEEIKMEEVKKEEERLKRIEKERVTVELMQDTVHTMEEYAKQRQKEDYGPT